MTNSIHYQWQGITSSGKKIKGLIESTSLMAAKEALRKQGVITHKIVKKRPFLARIYSNAIKQTNITVFTRQLSTLIKSGITLSQACALLEKGQESNHQMKSLITSIRIDLEAGLMLAQALGKHPASFNSLFCNMVAAGEQSGTLDCILDKMATYQENRASIKRKVRQALTYPMAVILIAIGVCIGLLTFVIPQFEHIFADFGAELPMLTRCVIYISDFFIHYWSIAVSLIISSTGGLMYAYKHSDACVKTTHTLILTLPIIGKIIHKHSISRFSRLLSILFVAGLPLAHALKSMTGTIGNRLYEDAIHNIQHDLSNGQSMSYSLQKTALFPKMVIQMINIGEASGTLDQMLVNIADFYESEVDCAVSTLNSLLEPVIMALLGLLIGGLVIAMYLPILKLGAVI